MSGKYMSNHEDWANPIHELTKKLDQAYKLIHKGMEEDDMLLVEEGFGFLSEVKAILEGDEGGGI
jgi:hypothetical protein